MGHCSWEVRAGASGPVRVVSASSQLQLIVANAAGDSKAAPAGVCSALAMLAHLVCPVARNCLTMLGGCLGLQVISSLRCSVLSYPVSS